MSGAAASLNPIAKPTDTPSGFTAILPAPFGALGVRMQGDRLAGLDFLPETAPCHLDAVPQVVAQLSAWFADPRFVFDLPLALHGTPFRQRVWAALMGIPVGQTQSYGTLAHRLGSSPRAVGQALGDNPIPIVIPCHRVLGARGLGGFMHDRGDFALSVKRWLLDHERG